MRENIQPSASLATSEDSGLLWDLPKEQTQASNDAWVKQHGAEDLIKLRGKGRTIEVVRHEMALYALGATTALALPPSLLLKAPEAQQAAQDAWVKDALGQDGKLIKLRGDGRTAQVVGEEIGLVVAGAKHVSPLR